MDIKDVVEWGWSIIGVLAAVVWSKHEKEIGSMKEQIKEVDDKVDNLTHNTVTLDAFETTRRELRDGQMAIFDRLDKVGQAIARIEGKMDR